METVGTARAVQLFMRGNRNYFAGRPLVVSFELTASCNANCVHCDKGGIVAGEKPLSPAEIGAIYRKLRPVAVQISGGEPLLRHDVVEVARAIKERNGAPYLIVVTNGRLLDAEKYLALRAAGVDQFSISIDFPDSRHDEFRDIPGLFEHLGRVVPDLTRRGHGDVVLNCAITRRNFEEVTRICEVATAWGSSISFSTYSALRTGDTSLLVSSPEDLRRLRDRIDALIEMRRTGWRIRNPVSDLESIYRFFAERGIPGCRAGYRFLLVTPDGAYRPCAHKPVRARSHEELVERFSRSNDCRGCYVAIRSYCDKTWGTLFREQIVNRMIAYVLPGVAASLEASPQKASPSAR